MALGGKREGAGRKKGLPNKRTQELVARAEAGGVMPIDVLLGDMRMYHTEGQQLFDQIRGKIVISPEEVSEFEALEKKASFYKQIARDCAEKAAPYLHPRLASIEAKVEVSNHETALAELE